MPARCRSAIATHSRRTILPTPGAWARFANSVTEPPSHWPSGWCCWKDEAAEFPIYTSRKEHLMKMNDMVIISVDDHISEPPDLFKNHLSGADLESAPKLVQDLNG